jgi:hypothetical protein
MRKTYYGFMTTLFLVILVYHAGPTQAASVMDSKKEGTQIMKELPVIKSNKSYKYFQFNGTSVGSLVGEITLNGVVMQKLEGEQAMVSNNAAQHALKYGENVIRFHIQAFAKPGPQEVEYAIVGVAANESGNPFDADHIIDIEDDLGKVSPLPATVEYRFKLDGEPFAVLKSTH